MLRPDDDRPQGRTRLRTALRGACFVVAAGLGVVAIWLIVTGTTQKDSTVGALVGFWAILMAAFPVFGSRHAPDLSGMGRQLEVRPSSALDRLDDANDRREYEMRLQLMLRREIQAALGPELASLRNDIAALRSELVEKVGGQLRLERIETTRVIGSDIEALQHEVRQLKFERQPAELGGFSAGTTTTSSFVHSVNNGVVAEPVNLADEMDAEVVDDQVPPAPEPVAPPVSEPVVPPAAPEPLVSEPAAPAPAAPAPFAAEPFVWETAPLEPHLEPHLDPLDPAWPGLTKANGSSAHTELPLLIADALEQAPAPQPDSDDPFAGMPRIRPFTEFELDPVEEQPDPRRGLRRRSHDESPTPSAPSAPSTGRHSGGDDPGKPTSHSSGRRRRDVRADDNVLARILEREGQPR